MYEKVKKFRNFVCKDSTQLKIAAIFAVIFILVLAYNDFLDGRFCYPEETYQCLEEEAEILVKTNSFETNYDLVVTNYDFKSKTLSMELSSSPAKLNIKFNNYGESNQEYYIYREDNSAVLYILGNISGILILSVFTSTIGVLIILILATMIQLIAFIIHKIIRLIRKK